MLVTLILSGRGRWDWKVSEKDVDIHFNLESILNRQEGSSGRIVVPGVGCTLCGSSTKGVLSSCHVPPKGRTVTRITSHSPHAYNRELVAKKKLSEISCKSNILAWLLFFS